MFIYELKKLLFKQYGLIFAVLCGLVQICMLIPLYDKADFPNAVTEAQYNSYMQIMEGRLTDEKTNFILSEQEQILTAQSDLIPQNLNSNLFPQARKYGIIKA